MAISYTPLQGDILKSLDIDPAKLLNDTPSLAGATSLIAVIFFMLIGGAAIYRYIYAGIARLEGGEQGVRKSNEAFKAATFGLLLIFIMFLLIATFNRSLLLADPSLDALKTGVTAPAVQTTSPSQTTSQTSSQTPASSGSASYQERLTSHTAAVARLAPSGIHTNYNDKPCTESQFNQSKPSCTSLAFLPEETIQMLLKLKSQCNCEVVITGGTEPGHITHKEYKRIIDLRLTGTRGSESNSYPLYVYLKNTATNKLGPSGNCYQRYVWGGWTFCDEKPPHPQHFHVY